MNREDCFANREGSCNALNEKNCDNCRFYRNDLNQVNIEQEVKKYKKEQE